MKYIVEEPNGNLHDITVPKNAPGQVCFEKICQKLGIVEQHYFGLTRSVNHETKAWLNLRNPLLTQHRPQITSKPHRLRLEVKFYVLPEEIQHETTRFLFYHALKRNINEEKFILSQSQLLKLYALIRQVEYGDYKRDDQTQPTISLVNAVESEICKEHELLKGTPKGVAVIKFITLLSQTEYYFSNLFKVKLGGEKLLVAVGIMGLQLLYRRNPHTTKEFVSYYDISKISLFEERMIVVTKRSDYGPKFLHFFHTSCEAAKVMHKCVLEKKLFYFEPKILDSVRNHYMLSFPCWAYPSKWMKKSASELYHLDVSCTRRQAYDEHFTSLHAPDQRKAKFPEGAVAAAAIDAAFEVYTQIPYCVQCGTDNDMVVYSPCGHIESCARCAHDLCGTCGEPVAQKLKAYLAIDGFSDELCCQICMDNSLSTVFSPCGHSYCCDVCAEKLDVCPMCKRWIMFAQRIQFVAMKENAMR